MVSFLPRWHFDVESFIRMCEIEDEPLVFFWTGAHMQHANTNQQQPLKKLPDESKPDTFKYQPPATV